MSEKSGVVLDCGKTIEELAEYLDAGRTPYDPDIETCPECLNALDSLARVGQLSRDLLEDDAAQLPPPPESWFQGIMTVIRSELQAGRSFPISHPDPRVTITITEGAVRALLRSVGDTLDGLFVGGTEIVGDAETPGAPVEINLSASVMWGRPIPELSDRLRQLAYDLLAQHTELNVTAVNVVVEDVHGYHRPKERP